MRQIARYLLGAFICVELAYLPLANFLQRVPRHPSPLPEEIISRFPQREGEATSSELIQSGIDTVGIGCDRWAESTGQGQGWSLFAPRFGEAGTFLTLQAITKDGTRTQLRSRFEPADPSNYIRYDVLNYRSYYREMSYALIYGNWTEASFANEPEAWREAIREHVRAFRRSLTAFVHWRFATELPSSEIKEVLINVRVFLPPNPDDDSARPAPIEVPLAKWTSNDPTELFPFNPITSQFAEPNQR